MSKPEAFEIRLSRSALRALAQDLPEAAAAAAWEFISGPLREKPTLVGKPLREPFADLWVARRGTYRIRYSIDMGDRVISILRITHRRDAYH